MTNWFAKENNLDFWNYDVSEDIVGLGFHGRVIDINFLLPKLPLTKFSISLVGHGSFKNYKADPEIPTTFGFPVWNVTTI